MTTQDVSLLIAINALVFWKAEKRPFLWVIGACLNIMVGLLYASTDVLWSKPFIYGVMIALLGIYCLTMYAKWAWLGRKGSTKQANE
jgi:hypothetical protein